MTIDGLIIASIILAVFGVVVILAIRFFVRRRFYTTYDHVIFLITVPQYQNKNESQDSKPTAFKERLSEVENLFSVLASIRAEKGWRAFFVGRQDHFSLEIVSNNQELRFYAAIPRHLADFFTQQLHAVYANAHAEEVPDYNIFQAQGSIRTGYLTFRKSFFFPVKTYLHFDRDPLESLTTALSRVPPDGGAVIQFVVRSARASWHQAGRRVAAEAYKTNSLAQAVKNTGSAKTPAGAIARGISGLFGILSAGTVKNKPSDPQLPHKQLSPKDQDAIKGIEEKTSKAGFDANIRIAVSMPDAQKAEIQLKNIIDAFGSFNIYEYGNSFKSHMVRGSVRAVRDFIYRSFDERASLLLNAEEMTTLFHLPEGLQTPNIRWLKAKKIAPPPQLPHEGILLGRSVFRSQSMEIKIADADRRRHVYIIGQTGTGKSELMKHMAVQDIKRGKGICLIDPHGDLVEAVLAQIPPERASDVILFDPSDTERPLALNMLEYDTPEQKTFVINEMINIFDKLYDLRQTGGPMFEQYMRNAMLLIMEDPSSGSTLLEIPRVMADDKFRKFKLSKTTNIVVKDFWEKEAQKAGGEAALANMVPYVTSKLTQFVANDIMRPIISQQKSSFNFRECMDERKILLVNLSKGKIGEMNSSLLGLVTVGKLLMAALSRVDIPESERKDFYLYIDEFQSYISPSIAIILSEARKYKLNLTVAHQYLGQLVKQNDTSVRDAVFGNVGTIVAFRVGVEDSEVISQQFAPVISEYDVRNIEKYHAYIRLLWENQNLPAFSFKPDPPVAGNAAQVIHLKQLSRLKYGRLRGEIEDEIKTRTLLPVVAPPPLPPLA